MIADNSSFFNTLPLVTTPKHFDDYEARLHHRLGQQAIPTLGGRHLLYFCPVCKRPWYRAGKREYPRLTHEQLVNLQDALHVASRHPDTWPQVLCCICSATHLGGIFRIEEYYQDRYPGCSGYQLSWESISVLGTQHLLAMIFSMRTGNPVSPTQLIGREPDTLSTPTRDVCSVLAWLDERVQPRPDILHNYTDEESGSLARRLPPGKTGKASGSVPCVWRGYSWHDTCPAWQGEVHVSLAIALPPLAWSPFPALLTSWRMLARAMRFVL